MIRKPVLKSILMGILSGTLAISLSACDNESSSETDAAQTLPSSSTNDTPATETTASTTDAPAPTGTVSSTQTAPPPAPVATDTTTTSPAPAPTNTSGSAAAAAKPFPGGGILWKPVSHGFGGRLVVLIPPSVAQPSTPIRVLDADGNTIDQGNYHNAHGENGGRHHFVFGRTGSAYPSPSILSIGGANYLIPNPGGRYE